MPSQRRRPAGFSRCRGQEPAVPPIALAELLVACVAAVVRLTKFKEHKELLVSKHIGAWLVVCVHVQGVEPIDNSRRELSQKEWKVSRAGVNLTESSHAELRQLTTAWIALADYL